jgi:hypothetical protein
MIEVKLTLSYIRQKKRLDHLTACGCVEWPAARKVSWKVEALVNLQLSPGDPRKDAETHFEHCSLVSSL